MSAQDRQPTDPDALDSPAPSGPPRLSTPWSASEAFATVFDDSPLPAIILNRPDAIHAWNRACEELLGWTAAEVLGRPMPGISADQRASFQDLIVRTLRGECPTRVEHALTTKTGAQAAVAISATSLRNERGEAVAALLFLNDATALENARLRSEYERAVQQLRQTQDQLVRSEKLRTLGQMSAGVAHDLNNVLGAILGQIDLLKLQTPDIFVGNALQTLENAAAEGTAVVRRLQSFARQSDTPNLVPLDLVALVRDVIEITRPRWRGEPRRAGRVITVEISLPAGLPRILGNAAELRDALTQLIFNAVDAMPHGGLLRIAGRLVDSSTSRVGVGTAPSSESTYPLTNQPASWVELTVTDTGLGMTEDIRRKLFDPYFTTKGAQGAGLGLSLVYGVVERHGGQIEAVSEPGRGTTFTLRLRSADAETHGLPSGAVGNATRGCRVLLIDDDPMVRETLAALLRATNHVVIEAEDGPGGLACLDKTRVDVVLTDFGMPGLTGWQVALAVKAKRPTVPVVLLTGWGDSAGEGDENATAVDRVLKKPIRLYDLLQVLAELLSPPNAA